MNEELIADWKMELLCYNPTSTHYAMIERTIAALESQDKEIAALKADAGRYRWLRDGGIYAIPYSDHGGGPEFDLTDAVIDAAMGAAPQAAPEPTGYIAADCDRLNKAGELVSGWFTPMKIHHDDVPLYTAPQAATDD